MRGGRKGQSQEKSKYSLRIALYCVLVYYG